MKKVQLTLKKQKFKDYFGKQACEDIERRVKEAFENDSSVFIFSMNFSKEIAVHFGAKHNPPYIWNQNIPSSWIEIICGEVADKLMKDKNWKPDAAFMEAIGKKLEAEG